jgi:hypothetical protein
MRSQGFGKVCNFSANVGVTSMLYYPKIGPHVHSVSQMFDGADIFKSWSCAIPDGSASCADGSLSSCLDRVSEGTGGEEGANAYVICISL